jgi:hypothetical protein
MKDELFADLLASAEEMVRIEKERTYSTAGTCAYV